MSKRLDWDQVVETIKNDTLPFFRKEGIKPTLRTLFYNLVSQNIIPNTKRSYTYLSERLVRARKDGIFEWDFIEDKVRTSIVNFSDAYPKEKELEEVEEGCEKELEELDIEELIENAFRYLKISDYVGYWAQQKTIIEVWCEKEALSSTLKNWLYGLSVNIRIQRGYSSWSFIYENVKDLKRMLKDNHHEEIIIFYLGDLDPSGVDIQRFLGETLEYFGMDQTTTLKRLAITPEHVEKYGLPPKPEDAETIAKLKRDPRYDSYEHEYIVELDALVAFVPSEFKEMLRTEIKAHHDDELNDKVKEEAKEIREKSKKIIDEAKKKALEKIIEEAKEMLENGL